MAYKTYAEQLQEHLQNLKDNNLLVSDLTLDKWVRCRSLSDSKGRGEYAYIINTENLNNGLFGIRTSFRGPNGSGSFKTYGLPPIGNESVSIVSNHCSNSSEAHEIAARKSYGFWEHSLSRGRSDYLERKGVGCYSIRFRCSDQYGNVAVVPMRDENGKLWSYQLLNPDGTKRYPKDCRTEGLFHKLAQLINGKYIGIAESYVTAATCMELSGVPTVCAFTSENLVSVSKAIRLLCPASHIIFFADNDRHLEKTRNQNVGILKAHQACFVVERNFTIAIPEFDEIEPSKEASDWNDLVRLIGIEKAKNQLAQILSTLVQ